MSDPDAQPYLDTAGRWFSPDPLIEEYSSWSPYHVVYNNPISNIDPDVMQILLIINCFKMVRLKELTLMMEVRKILMISFFATDKNGNVDNSKVFQIDKAEAGNSTTISKLESQNMSSSQVVKFSCY